LQWASSNKLAQEKGWTPIQNSPANHYLPWPKRKNNPPHVQAIRKQQGGILNL